MGSAGPAHFASPQREPTAITNNESAPTVAVGTNPWRHLSHVKRAPSAGAQSPAVTAELAAWMDSQEPTDATLDAQYAAITRGSAADGKMATRRLSAPTVEPLRPPPAAQSSVSLPNRQLPDSPTRSEAPSFDPTGLAVEAPQEVKPKLRWPASSRRRSEGLSTATHEYKHKITDPAKQSANYDRDVASAPGYPGGHPGGIDVAPRTWDVAMGATETSERLSLSPYSRAGHEKDSEAKAAFWRAVFIALVCALWPLVAGFVHLNVAVGRLQGEGALQGTTVSAATTAATATTAASPSTATTAASPAATAGPYTDATGFAATRSLRSLPPTAFAVHAFARPWPPYYAPAVRGPLQPAATSAPVPTAFQLDLASKTRSRAFRDSALSGLAPHAGADAGHG